MKSVNEIRESARKRLRGNSSSRLGELGDVFTKLGDAIIETFTDAVQETHKAISSVSNDLVKFKESVTKQFSTVKEDVTKIQEALNKNATEINNVLIRVRDLPNHSGDLESLNKEIRGIKEELKGLPSIQPIHTIERVVEVIEKEVNKEELGILSEEEIIKLIEKYKVKETIYKYSGGVSKLSELKDVNLSALEKDSNGKYILGGTTGGGSGGQVNTVVGGTGVTVNSTDPVNPIINLSTATVTSLGKADTAVQSITEGAGIEVDATVPTAPEIKLNIGSLPDGADPFTGVLTSADSIAFSNSTNNVHYRARFSDVKTLFNVPNDLNDLTDVQTGGVVDGDALVYTEDMFLGSFWKPFPLRPLPATGGVIEFVAPRVYNLPSSPETGNITDDLTGANIGVIQKIYHNHTSAPSFPAGWVLVGGEYVTSELNIIYAEWVEGTRVEYWIVQEA